MTTNNINEQPNITKILQQIISELEKNLSLSVDDWEEGFDVGIREALVIVKKYEQK